MEIKKRKRILLFALGTILLAGAIGGVYALLGTDSITATEERFYNPSMVNGFASENGFYHTNSTGFLYFFDYKAGQDVIVCNKPNCTHSVWYDDTPDEQRCNAYLSGFSHGFVLEDSLYILKGDLSTQTISIIKSGLDRAARTEIAKTEGDIVYPFVIKDQFLYMTGSVGLREKDEDGMEVPTGEYESWIFSVDLRTGTVTELSDRIRHFNGGLFIVGVYGDDIYCKDDYFESKYDGTNYLEAKRKTDWYTYNIVTGQLEQILSGHSFEEVHIYGNKLIGKAGTGFPKDDMPYEFEQYQITVLDIGTGEIHTIVDANRFLGFVDGKIFYVVEQDENQSFHYFDIDRGKTVEMSSEFLENMHIRGVAGDYMYVLLDDPDTGESSPHLILKSDFYRENEAFISLVWKESGY